MDSVPLLLEEDVTTRSKLGSFFQLIYHCSTFVEKIFLIFGILFSLLSGALSPFTSFIFGELTQVIVNATSALNNKTLSPSELEADLVKFEHGMNTVIFHFALCGLLYFLFTSIQASTFRFIGERITYRIRQKYVYKLLKKDAQFFDTTSTGHLSTILNDNLERLRESLNDKISLICQLCTDFTIGFIYAFILDWKLSAYSSVFAIGIAVSGVFNSYSIMDSTEKQNTHYANAGSIAFQALGAFKTVVSLNGQKQELDNYKEELNIGEKHGVRKAFFYGISRAVQYFFVYSLNCLCMYLGANLIYSHTLSTQTIVQLFHNLLFAGFSLSEAFPMFSVVAAGISAAEPIARSLYDEENEIESDDEANDDNLVFEGRIRLNNVHFAYPSRPDDEVLKGVSLEVENGECVALVGASGSGKSTIVQLLLHYYNISSGEILVDDENLQNINLKKLRETIGVVSQEPVLFNTTIEENVKFGNPAASSAQVYAALRKANAYDFVCGFPKGIKTVVGERGTQLSGGQKQRIAIARTLLRNPKILLLDEATSALDNESEHIVQKALENASQGRTTIVVAHRLSTIRNANKIIVMQKGKIVEVGNHEQLLEKQGIYSELIKAQVMDSHDEEENTSALVSRQLSSELTQVNVYAHQRSISSEPNREQEDHMERLIEELAEEGAVKSSLWEILYNCRSDTCLLVFAFLASAAQGFNYPILAQIIANVYEAYAMNGEDILYYGHFWALMFMVLAVTRAATIFGQYYCFGKISERLSTRLRVASFEHLLALPCPFYDDPKHSPTKLSTRLNADASNVKAAVDARFGSLIMTAVAFVVAIVLSITYSWKMTLEVIALCPFLYLGGYAYESSVESSVAQETIAFENCNKTAVEAIEHVRTVRALTMENKIMSMLADHLANINKSSLKRSVIQGVAYGFSFCSFFFVYAISFKFGVWLVLRREIMPTDVYRVLMCLAMTSNTAGAAIAYFPDYKKAIYAAGLIFKLFTYTATMHSQSKDGLKNIDDGQITGEDLHFHYEQRPDHMILKGVNLRVDGGKSLALVGPSGCGKSTIISLLERFYHTVEGEMTIDKTNVEDINLHHLRSSLALVSQEPTLFNCSIRENLSYGLTRQLSQLEIEKALQIANAYKFVFSFPQGLDTIVGERGAQLSGGQKQRIAIARAILRKPKVLLLDEATSALDTDSEKVVQNALDTASARLSTVIVAHRLSTIVNADTIAVLKNGKVVEQGTHDELLRKRNVYWRLVQKQGKEVLKET